MAMCIVQIIYMFTKTYVLFKTWVVVYYYLYRFRSKSPQILDYPGHFFFYTQINLFFFFWLHAFSDYIVLDITLDSYLNFPSNCHHFEISLSLIVFLSLKSICVIWIWSSSFLLLNVGMIFFHSFIFNLSAYLYFIYVSQKHIYMSFIFCFQHHNFFLLVEAYTSFTLDLIINIFNFKCIILLFTFCLHPFCFHFCFFFFLDWC